MDIIERGLEILKQLGLTYEWQDHTHSLLEITDPVTGEWTRRFPYGAACLLDFLVKTGKLKLDDEDAFLAQVEELNRLAETFGNSVVLSPDKRLRYWRHSRVLNPKDRTSLRILTAKDALDPKRKHQGIHWYFGYDETVELRNTILHDQAIYAQHFTIKD